MNVDGRPCETASACAAASRRYPLCGKTDFEEEAMSDMQLTISGEEREFLSSLLETVLKETRIEEHRTRAPSYREHIVRKEELILSLQNKLGAVAVAGG
jgi:hypothetical protein